MDSPCGSSAGSSRDSYTKEDVKDAMDTATAHVAKVMVSLRVHEMEKRIREGGGKPKGKMPEKAKQYAELYTQTKLNEHLAKKTPALSEKRWEGIIESVDSRKKRRESIFDFLRPRRDE